MFDFKYYIAVLLWQNCYGVEWSGMERLILYSTPILFFLRDTQSNPDPKFYNDTPLQKNSKKELIELRIVN